MGVQLTEKAWAAAQTTCGHRSDDELQKLRYFVLGSASRGELIHSGPSGRGTLFWNLSEDSRKDACQNLILRQPSPSTMVFQDGAKAEELFIILRGSVRLQLMREDLDLGAEDERPRAPVDEVVALEGPLLNRPGACDFALEEKGMVAANTRTTLRLLRGRTDMALSRLEPDSPVSPRAPLSILSKKSCSPLVVGEEEAFAGSILAAATCMAGSTHKWRAIAGENCQLLVMNSKCLGRAIKKELKRRHTEREKHLLNALGGPIKGLENEKLHALAVGAKTVLYRRGEVLCGEGETRTPKSRLQVLMHGEVRCVRSGEKAKGTSIRQRRDAMHSAGTLLPGQAVNAASILADEPEPFAVVVDSAEALVISLTAAELARVVSMPVMEQLKVMNLERLQWRLQLPTSSTPRSHGRAPRSSRADAPGKAVPNQELVRLDNVLHDRPEIVCQSPRQPPGIIQNIGKDMMRLGGTEALATSSLSVRRPNMQMECPRVHPALIPHLKDLRLKAKPARPGSEDLTATATTETDLVTRSCDDWGLRSADRGTQGFWTTERW
eukprot:g24247.t1